MALVQRQTRQATASTPAAAAATHGLDASHARRAVKRRIDSIPAMLMLAVGAMLLALMLVGCSDEPMPTPAPTLTPVPTQTPTPSPEPLDTLELSGTTVGKDLTDRLSDEEATCIRRELGDADYQAFQADSFVTELERAYERPLIERALLDTLFRCMSADNTPVLGVAVMDAHAGGWVRETRSCISGVVDEHPEVVYVWLGVKEVDSSIEEHVQTTHTYFLDLWDCLTDEEKVEFTVHSWSVSEGVNGQDLMSGILSEGEIACLEENLPEGSLDQIRNVGSLRETFVIPGVAVAAQVCLEPDIYNRIFVGGFAKRTEGLSEGSAACVLQFTIDHAHYMTLAQNRDLDISTLSVEELAETASDGRKLLECLTEEELTSYQDSFGDRWYREPR